MQDKLDYLWPYPQELSLGEVFPLPEALSLRGMPLRGAAEDVAAIVRLPLSDEPRAYPLTLALEPQLGRSESYHLLVEPSGACLVAADSAGLAHGWQTLLQVLVLAQRAGTCATLAIQDWPAYRRRAFMVDLGRSVFSLPFLQRIVRILARLKMNELHLHLYDDELCGLCFPDLPFGTENPHSISLADLGALVTYADRYHVRIVPELEAWGHVGSLVYHRPELRGGDGMYAGSSFLVGEDALALMRTLIAHVVSVMPQEAIIHLGLDEAQWFLDPSMPPHFTPEDLVGRYDAMLQEIAQEQGKELTLQVWADHAGRPIPPQAQPHTIVQPWQYWIKNREHVDRAIARYSGAGKMRWMMGAGQSMAQYRGAFHCTRYWCQRAADSPNVEGVDITFWETNDLEQKFISLFAGAYYAWNPFPPTPFAGEEDYERFDQHVFPRMYAWQRAFRDADPEALRKARGPLVFMGRYLWGEHHGQPVAPTVIPARTAQGLDFLDTNEQGHYPLLHTNL